MPPPDAQGVAAPDWIEAGRLLFARECGFRYAAGTVERLPPPGLPEIAFAGRSNAGKSSLINALTGRNALARTSRTPGRTQELIFFELGTELMLVDMPGYGYAAAPVETVKAWSDFAKDLSARPAQSPPRLSSGRCPPRAESRRSRHARPARQIGRLLSAGADQGR